MIHTLKTDPGPFSALWSKKKTYEVRRDDRGFEVGDTLVLNETLSTSGRYVLARVIYKTPGGSYGLPSDTCVLGIEELSRGENRT